MSTRSRKLILRLPVPQSDDYMPLWLTEDCPMCDGTGGPTPGCGRCRGIGQIPTSEGLVLLELFYRYADVSDDVGEGRLLETLQ